MAAIIVHRIGIFSKIERYGTVAGKLPHPAGSFPAAGPDSAIRLSERIVRAMMALKPLPKRAALWNDTSCRKLQDPEDRAW